MTTSDSAVGARWLLLHGTPLTPQVWDGVTALLRPHGEVVCPDTTPRIAEDTPQAAAAARIVADVVAQTPTGERWHVVGHSYGGQVALETARLMSDRMSSLTIFCSRASPFPAFADAAGKVESGVVDHEAAIARWFPAEVISAGGPMVQYARTCLQAADPRTWAVALRGIAGYDWVGDAPSVAAPTALFAADHDLVSTPTAMAETAARIPNAVLHVDADAWHMTPFLQPQRMVNFILERRWTS